MANKGERSAAALDGVQDCFEALRSRAPVVFGLALANAPPDATIRRILSRPARHCLVDQFTNRLRTSDSTIRRQRINRGDGRGRNSDCHRGVSASSRAPADSDEALADQLGHTDAILKGAEAECKALKDEFKRRGLLTVAGNEFTVTSTEQISDRPDTKAVREFLGEAYHRFENAVVSTVIRVKAVNRLAAAA